MSGLESAVIGGAWAVVGCWRGVAYGHSSLRMLALCALIWPIAEWIRLCEWIDRRAGDWS